MFQNNSIRKSVFFFLLSIVSLVGFAQPSNDGCTTPQVINLGSAGAACINSTNAGATSDLTTNACDTGLPGNEVWYTFTATGVSNTVTVTPLGGGGSAQQVVVTLQNTGCASGTYNICDASTNNNGAATASWSYNVGEQVLVSVETNGNDGGFELCVNSVTPPPSPGSSCATASTICNKNDFTLATFPPNVTVFSPSCFGGNLQRPVFYQFTVGQSGTCEFTADPLGNAEYDWVMYDITGGCPGTAVCCNFNWASATGAPMGMAAGAPNNCGTQAAGGAAGEFSPPANLTIGSTYLLIIDNYSNNTVGFDMSWGGTFDIAPTPNFTVNPTTGCAPLTSSFTNISTATTSYSWNFANGNTSTATNPGSQTYTTPGTYLVSLVGTSATGCTDVVSQSIVVKPIPTMIAPADQTICAGTSVATAALTSTPTGATFAWSNSNTAIGLAASGTGNVPTFTATNTTTAPITSTITVTPTANGCPGAPVTYTITVNPTPIVNSPANQNVCVGQSVAATNFTGTTGATFSWSNSNTATGLAASGTGNITSFTGTNTGTTPITSTVTVTPSIGSCVGTPVNFTITINPEPTSTIAGTPPLCNGGATGSVDLTPSGGTTPYGYLWSNGAVTQDLSNVLAGTYDVTITDNLGCTTTNSVTLTDPPILTATLGKVDASCAGICNGTATATPAGGVGPYTYSWNGGAQTSQTATALCAGNYTVVVTDFNGCTVTESITIVNLSIVTADVVPVDANCGLSDGSVTGSGSGGTTPYTYSWNTGTYTGATVNGIPAGVYDLIVTDVNGCVGTASGTINTTAGPTVSISGSTDVSCNGGADGTATTSIVNGTAPITYSWTPAGGTAANATGLSANVLYTVTATDANTCSSSATVTLSEPPLLSITSTSSNSNCGQSDGSVSSTPAGGTTPYSFSWSDGTSVVGTTQNVGSLPAGSYTVTVTDGNSCTATSVIAVSNNTAGSIAISQVDVTCNGLCNGTANAVVTGGTAPITYSWDNPSGSVGANVTGLCAGPVTVTATDAVGCIVTGNITILEPAVLTATVINPMDVTCFGFTDGTAEASPQGGTAPYTYAWNSVPVQTGVTANSLAPGGYSVVITDNNGCTVNAATTINEPAEMQLSGTDVDAHCNLADGSATVTVVNAGVAPFTYSWSVGTPSVPGTATGIAPGTTTATVTDFNGCIQTLDINVGNIAAGVVNITSSNNPSCNGICDGGIVVNMTGTGTAPYTYLWNDPSGQTVSNPTGLCDGSFDVVVTDANGCVSNLNATLIEPTGLSLIVNPTNPTCYNVCDGSLEANISGGVGPYTYLWDDALQQTTQIATGLCDDGLPYSVTVTDANGCEIDKGGLLTEPTEVLMDSIVTNASCGQADGDACVSVSGGTSPYTVVWQNNASTNLCQANLGANTYIVDAADANGCPAQLAVTVSDLSGPVASISGSVDVLCDEGNNGSATGAVVGGLAPYSYLWSAAAGSQTTPTASNLTAGTFSLVITDANGCTASTSIVINQPDTLQINGNVTDPTCFGDCDGQIDVSNIGGVQPYSYSWNDPASQTTASATGLCQGNYTVIVTDANGCVITNSYDLTNPLQVNASGSFLPVTCNGLCDGSVTMSAVNGVAPVSYTWDDSNNQTGVTAFGLCAGTYNGLAVDANGCSTTIQLTVTEPTALAVVLDVKSDVTCNAACNGLISVIASGGSTPYTYLWNNGATTSSISNVCAGNYSVTITDANGCQVVYNETIAEPLALQGSFANNDVTCFGSNNGNSSYSVSGGVQPYSFLWDDGLFQTTSNATNLTAGNYQVVVTDANGCTLTGNTILTQPSQLTTNLTVTSTNCFQNNGQICAVANGGIAPYQYQYNDPQGQTTSCASSILAGTYTLVITDGNACTFDTIVNVNNLVGPTIVLNGTVDPSCNGLSDGYIGMTVTGGTLPYSNYHWEDATGTTIGFPNSSILDQTGAGCFTLGVTDAAGCSFALTECLIEPNALTSAVTSSANATCNLACNGSATLSIQGGVAPYATLWNSGQTTNTITNLCAGNYTANVTDANGCTSSSPLTITEPAPLVSNVISQQDISCNSLCDGTVQIGVTGGTAPYLNIWNPSGVSGNSISGLCAGNFLVTTTDANGCSFDLTGTITEPALLTGSITITPSTCGFCNGAAAANAVGGTSPYAYNWSNGQSTVGATNLCAGNVTTTITDANGCILPLAEVVNDLAGPVINSIANVSPSCNGLSNGSASPDFVGGTAPFTYLWTNGQIVQNAVALNAGNHCITITDDNGCIATSCVNITQPNPLLAIPDGTTTICYGEQTQVWASGSGGTMPYAITWNGLNTSGFVGSGPITVSPTTSQDYCFNVTDDNGCLSPNVCVEITVTPALNAQLPTDIFICDGSDYLIEGVYSGGNGDPYTYSWYENVYPGAVVATTADYNATPTGTTSYIVELNDGCSDAAFDTIIVDINPNPVAFLNVLNPAECAPGIINFTANSDIGVSYEWDYQCDGIVDNTTGLGTATFTYQNPGVYDICLNIISADGCETSISEIGGVEIFSNPIASFTTDPLVTSVLDPVVNFIDQSTDAYYWYWDFTGDGTVQDSSQNPTYFYDYPGTYDVNLVVYNTHGCSDSIEVPYTIMPDQNIFVPNAFSPDDDGVNDYFFVNGIGLDTEVFDIYVFNRWGQVIWEGHNPADQWDGTFLNQDVQTDVYVWKLNTVDINGRGVELRGHVTVIR